MAKKTLATIRSGIAYQDLIAAESLLRMLDSSAPPTSVTLEDRRGGKFDDVVEWYPTRTIWQQVKWSEHPASEPFTLKGIAEAPPKRKTSLVAGFAATFKKLKGDPDKNELHLISNRTADAELQAYLEGEPPRLKPKLTKKQRESLEKAWLKEAKLTKAKFRELLSVLRLRVGTSDLAEREQSIRARLRALGLPDVFDQFMAAIARWASDASITEITADNVRDALGPIADYPNNRFALRRDTFVARRSVHRNIAKLIGSNGSGYFAILSPPGTGKSTALNTLTDSAEPSLKHIIVYNCFTGVGDTFLLKRASADNFALFLAKQLYQRFGMSWGSRVTARGADIEAMLAAAATRLTGNDRLILAIDGLDHAQRNKPTHDEGLVDVLPPVLPARVVIIVSAQSAEQLPAHLRTLDPDRILTMPPLTETETERLLERFGVFKGKWVKTSSDRTTVRRAVHALSKGHPLHTTYVARTVAEEVRRGEVAQKHIVTLVNGLDAYDSDVRTYYSKLFATPTALARRLIGVLAAAPFPLTPAEAASFILSSADAIAAEDAIAPYAMLFERRDDQLAFAHDSLRAYAREKSWSPLADVRPLVEFLKNRPRDPRHGEYLPALLVQAGDQGWAKSNIDCNWLGRQLALGGRPALVQEGIEELAANAAEIKDWPAVARWSLLRERLSEASSFELETLTLFKAWLDIGLLDRVRRRAFDGELLDLHWSAALDLAEVVEQSDLKLAKRLRAAAADEPLREPADLAPGRIDDAEKYVRNLALQWTPDEVMAQIQEFVDHQTTSLQQRPAEGKRLTEHLAAAAAWACFQARDSARLDKWLAMRPSRLPMKHVEALNVFTAMRKKSTTRSTPALKRVLKGSRNWTLIGTLRTTHKKLIVDHVRKLGLPAVLAVHAYSWFETEQRLDDLFDLFHDVRTSSQLGLNERIDKIDAAVDELEPASHRPLCRLMVILGKASVSQTIQWALVASDCLTEIKKMDHGAVGLNRSGPIEHFMRRTGQILLPLANLAVAAGASVELATFTEQELVPALNTIGLYYPAALDSVLTYLIKPDDALAVYERLLDTLETYWRTTCQQKSGALLRIAAHWASIDKQRALSALDAGTRAAFTYGYHKDITVNATIESLSAVAKSMNEELEEAAIEICIALGVVDCLTDYDHVGDNAAALVAAVAVADLSLAARVAVALHARLSNHMWRTSIAEAATSAGLDLGLIRQRFWELAPGIPIGSKPVEGPTQQQRTFADLLKVLSETASDRDDELLGARESLKRDLIQAASGDDELETAATVVLQNDHRDHESLAHLAQRAAQLNQLTTAFDYAARSIAAVGAPFMYAYWHTGATRALVQMCRLDPVRARPIFEHVVQEAVVGEYGIGFAALPILCDGLMGLGDEAAGRGILHALIDHLKEITSIYPRHEAAWRALFQPV